MTCPLRTHFMHAESQAIYKSETAILQMHSVEYSSLANRLYNFQLNWLDSACTSIPGG